VRSAGEVGLVERGVIEGFYGRPFSHAQRLALLRFAGERGFNCYVYAPKNDPLHRERWREPYPETELHRFRELAATGAAHGVRLVYALAPGLTYDAAEPRDFEHLEAKVHDVIAAGARGIALLFDDLTADSTTLDPAVQATLIARTGELVAAIDPTLVFWFIGNFYCGDATELRSGTGFWSTLYGRSAADYFAAYDAFVPASVPIMWTGPAVFSGTISARDAADFRAIARRPVVLWDNFPVNDALPGQIFLGPYLGREPDALAELHGVVLNLMSQACANQIPLATAADCLADAERYEPESSLTRAVASLAPDATAAVHLAAFVAQHRGHPVLAAGAAAIELQQRIAAAFAAQMPDVRALAVLREHLVLLADNEQRLRDSLGAHAILVEIEPWSRQLTRLARAALAGLDALQGLADRTTYEKARDLTRAHDEVVAATRLPQSLLPFVAGHGEPVDRFAALFKAIDDRLGAS